MQLSLVPLQFDPIKILLPRAQPFDISRTHLHNSAPQKKALKQVNMKRNRNYDTKFLLSNRAIALVFVTLQELLRSGLSRENSRNEIENIKP
jgi:hypothetical protein